MQKLHAAAETDATALTERAAQLVAAGRIGAARPLLAAARRLAPGSAELADISAQARVAPEYARRRGARDRPGRRSRAETCRTAQASRRTAPAGRRYRRCRARCRRSGRARSQGLRRQGSARRPDAGTRTHGGRRGLSRRSVRCRARQSRVRRRTSHGAGDGRATPTRRSPRCCAASMPHPARSIRATPPSCCACAGAISARPSAWRRRRGASASPTPAHSACWAMRCPALASTRKRRTHMPKR